MKIHDEHGVQLDLRVVFGGFALIYLALLPPGIYAVDGNSMFAVADSLATDLSVATACDAYTQLGPDGSCYSIWYPLLSFLAAPFAALGHVAGDVAGVGGVYPAEQVALVVPALAGAGASTVTAAIAMELSRSRRAALLAAVGFAFGTEALTYSRSFFAETLAAFLVALAVWGTVGEGKRRTIGLAAIGLAVLAKPPLAVVGPAIALVLAYRSRSWRRGLEPLASTAIGVLVYMAYNAARFSDPLDFGGPSRFSADNYLPPDIIEIVGLLLVSPGRGVVWFSAVALVGAYFLLRHRHETLPLVCLGVSLALLFAYISHPYGGWDWGDRLLMPALPLLCAGLGLATVRWRPFVLALIFIGLVSQIPTTLGFYERAYAESRDAGQQIVDNRWSVPDSPLIKSWPAMVNQLRDAWSQDVNEVANSTGGPPANSVQGEQLLQVVALWWWLLPVVGIPWWLGAVAALAAILMGTMLLVASTRASTAAPREQAPPFREAARTSL